jgi:hypothetical protein
MVGMHRLQWSQIDLHRCVGLDAVEQIRLGQQRPAHRHELESGGHRPVHGLAVGDAAQQDQRQLQFGPELSASRIR